MPFVLTLMPCWLLPAVANGPQPVMETLPPLEVTVAGKLLLTAVIQTPKFCTPVVLPPWPERVTLELAPPAVTRAPVLTRIPTLTDPEPLPPPLPLMVTLPEPPVVTVLR